MIKNLCIISCFILMVNCTAEKCIDGINLLPMYGNVKKCKQQIEIDHIFLKECEEWYSSKNEAYIQHIFFAGDYLSENDFDSAIKRYNQAWLIDSIFAEAYWGFGIVLRERKQYEESNKMLEVALQKYNNEQHILSQRNESNIWMCLALNNADMFKQTKDSTYITQIVDRIKKKSEKGTAQDIEMEMIIYDINSYLNEGTDFE